MLPLDAADAAIAPITHARAITEYAFDFHAALS